MGGLAYDCRGVDSLGSSPTRHVHPAVAAFVAAARPDVPQGSHTAELMPHLRAVKRLDANRLTPFERVLGQNAALSVALRSTQKPVLMHAAAGVVNHLALSPAKLATLGAGLDPAVERFLGPREAWVERKGDSCGDGRLLFHDRVYGGTRSFRPVRVGEWRALLAQLVAIDTAGRPHVSPFVAGIEIRRGLSPRSPACVVELDPRTGALHAAPFADLHQTVFVRATSPGRLACTNCHGERGFGDFYDVAHQDAPSLLANRRDALFALVREKLQPTL
jgi:hypothetical protein